MEAATSRPATYDRAVTDHIPLMRRIASRLGIKDRDDFVQDVCAEMFVRWSCHSDRFKFATWVWICAINVTTKRKIESRALKRSGRTVPMDLCSTMPATAANQEEFAELADVLSRMSGTRDSEVLIRHAMGETLSEIGRDYGIRKERVRQLCERERRRISAAA